MTNPYQELINNINAVKNFDFPFLNWDEKEVYEACMALLERRVGFQLDTYLLEVMRSGYFVQQNRPDFLFIEFEAGTIQSLSFQEIDRRLSDFGFSPISLKKNRRAYRKEVQDVL